MFTVIASFRSPHQLEHQHALIAGLKNHGLEAKQSFSELETDTELVACWGWRIGKKLFDRGHKVLVMERGYIGDRFKYSSLGWNGLNGYATFPEYLDDNGKRFTEHGGIIHPWKNKEGEYALLLGQVPGDQSLQGMDMIPWYEEKAKEINDVYSIPVVFRQHPDLKKRGIIQNVKGTVKSIGSLHTDLEDARFTVCYNSNSSVDSVLYGVPSIVGDKGSMAYEMASKSITDIIRPDREQWAHALAWKQWTIEEIKEGNALKGIVDNL